MPKEKKIEAYGDYVVARYVDDTVLCSHHPCMMKRYLPQDVPQ